MSKWEVHNSGESCPQCEKGVLNLRTHKRVKKRQLKQDYCYRYWLTCDKCGVQLMINSSRCSPIELVGYVYSEGGIIPRGYVFH
jgi:hypothetical protein